MKIFLTTAFSLFLSSVALSPVALSQSPSLIGELSEAADPLLQPMLATLQNNAEAMTLLSLYGANQIEIKLAELALEKSNSDEIIQYAKNIIADHTLANAKIFTLAEKERLSLDRAGGVASALLSATMDQLLGQLALLSDVDFDKSYLNANIVLHVKTISQLSGAKLLLMGGSVEQLVDEILPKLAAHLTQAKVLRMNYL